MGNEGELRTLGDLRRLHREFFDAGEDFSKAKDFDNVIHPPIFKNPDETLVLDLIPPPELHLLLGSVNTLYTSMA